MGMMPPFIHLRVHSTYSLSEGAIAPKTLVKLCRQHAMPAVAVTDSNNLFGALEFSLAAQEAGVQPIIGLQLQVTAPEARSSRNPHLLPPEHLVLLAKDEAGYRNLMRLSSHAFLETEPSDSPQVGLQRVAACSEGLIALTGGPSGRVARLLAGGQKDAAAQYLAELQQVFDGRLYIELQRHSGGTLHSIETRAEAGLLDFAYDQSLPLVATNNVHFAVPEFYEAHDALLCIADGRVIGETDRRRLAPDYHFASTEEMRERFADLPEACDNTLVVAERCAVMHRAVKNPILPPFTDGSGQSEEALLRQQAEDGLALRLKTLPPAEDPTPYHARLSFELEVILKMGFAGYFLIVSDFIRWAKGQGIPVGPGRGSGAGSVVAWALQITDLDPLRLGLLFERFLNPERVSMPDFDIDFCQDRREEVINYVQQRYGADRVAAIITFGKLKARAALRDAGRVLQMPYGQVDRICKMVPDNPANPVTLQEAIDGEPALQAQRDQDSQVKKLLEIALKLEGLTRHASTHAAGIVIGDRPLVELVPLYRDPGATLPASQFDMKMSEKAGLVKFDFLGLKTLSVMQQTVRMLEARGISVDLARLPLDDAKSYKMMEQGETVGVFQLESAGMRDTLRQLRPNRFEDIVALVALYRPGPMANIPRYIAVKHGKESPEYPHPSLIPVLEETYGIPVYQEQVMQMAQILAGYSLGGADLLRRAMGKKIKEEMAQQKAVFVEGAGRTQNLKAEEAEAVFALIERFADYGFNKSHAAAYALIAYQTGWLKANYPVEFMAASMNYELGNTDRLNQLRQEVLRLGIPLLPPDINCSAVLFQPEAQADGRLGIRYALAALKGVGATAMQPLVESRRIGGPFTDLFDFAERGDQQGFNRKALESLICAGAFDSLNKNRAQVLAATDFILRTASASAQAKATGQDNLFADPGVSVRPQLPAVPPWDELTRLDKEFTAVGFYLSAHPLDSYAGVLQRLGVISPGQLRAQGSRHANSRVKLAGVVVSKSERTARTGNRFAFVQMSGPDGMFEVTLFAETLSQCREQLEAGRLLLVTADVQMNGEEMRLTASQVQPLEEVLKKSADQIRIELDELPSLPLLLGLLGKLPKGKSRITLVVAHTPEEEAEIDLPDGFQLGPHERAQLTTLSGVRVFQ